MAVASIQELLADRRSGPEAVLDHIEPGADLVAGAANAEPVTVLDAIEDAAEGLERVRLHRMFPLRDRRYIDGKVPNLRHVSWFLSPHDKDAFHGKANDDARSAVSRIYTDKERA